VENRRDMLVLAPSGSGKTFYAKKGGWFDGDEIVEQTISWPKEDHWWKDGVLDVQHLEWFRKASEYVITVAAKKGSVAWWTYVYDDSFPLLKDDEIIIWIPSSDELRRNLSKRDNDSQPSEIDAEGIIALKEFAKIRAINIVSDVNKLIDVIGDINDYTS